MNWKRIIVDAGLRLRDAKLTVETWGNISCRADDLVYITPSGMDYGVITEDDVVVTDLNGKIVQGDRKPSIETPLHLAVYNIRPDVNAVIHTHAIHSNIFACIGEDIPLFHDEAAQTLGDTVRCADYCLPGTVELAESCTAVLAGKANACLLRNHGAVCAADSMDNCFKVAVVLEMMAELYYKIRAMDCSCAPLADEHIRIMQEFVKTRYGQK